MAFQTEKDTEKALNIPVEIKVPTDEQLIAQEVLDLLHTKPNWNRKNAGYVLEAKGFSEDARIHDLDEFSKDNLSYAYSEIRGRTPIGPPKLSYERELYGMGDQVLFATILSVAGLTREYEGFRKHYPIVFNDERLVNRLSVISSAAMPLRTQVKSLNVA